MDRENWPSGTSESCGSSDTKYILLSVYWSLDYHDFLGFLTLTTNKIHVHFNFPKIFKYLSRIRNTDNRVKKCCRNLREFSYNPPKHRINTRKLFHKNLFFQRSLHHLFIGSYLPRSAQQVLYIWAEKWPNGEFKRGGQLLQWGHRYNVMGTLTSEI